ncbi:MAG TPA: response regulator [Roseimicrobium sp.]|nr:response regulator [Roseimicrobium sp.]
MEAPKHTVLLIEDNADDEALSMRAITRCGVPCQVEVIRTGADALLEMLSQNTKPDLVLLDFHLPGLNGLQILQELRRRGATHDVPIVMFSCLQSSKEVSECLSEGASSFVRKPNDPTDYTENLKLTVRYWLAVDTRPAQLERHSRELTLN